MRRLLENYCFVLLTNKAAPHISDSSPDMRHRALFVTSRAAWRWNKMLLALENVDSPLAAVVLAIEHTAFRASGCQPPVVDNETGSRLNPVPAAWGMHRSEAHFSFSESNPSGPQGYCRFVRLEFVA